MKSNILSLICKALQTRTHLERFNGSQMTFVNQLLGLIVGLSHAVRNWSFLEQPLPLFLLHLSSIYEAKPLLQNQLVLAFAVLILHDEAIGAIEAEDLAPLFTLVMSERMEVAEPAALTLANAVQQSPALVINAAMTARPLGVHGL
jgi:hypothetical protein